MEHCLIMETVDFISAMFDIDVLMMFDRVEELSENIYSL